MTFSVCCRVQNTRGNLYQFSKMFPIPRIFFVPLFIDLCEIFKSATQKNSYFAMVGFTFAPFFVDKAAKRLERYRCFIVAG